MPAATPRVVTLKVIVVKSIFEEWTVYVYIYGRWPELFLPVVMQDKHKDPTATDNFAHASRLGRDGGVPAENQCQKK